jgi:hypothetical protein
MGICEVKSPVSTTTPGSKLSSNLPLSPGARSDPGRRDSVPNQPSHGARKGDVEPPRAPRVSMGTASMGISGQADFPASFIEEPERGHEPDPAARTSDD